MKMNQIFKYNFILLLLISTTVGWSKDQIEKKKYVEKSYTINSSTLLSLRNKFGEIEINSWEKNEFSIKVEIIGRGRSEDRAQRILDRIDIEISETTSEIEFETSINNMKNNSNEGFEVNYTISMPEVNPLDIRNSFGDVFMGNRSGDLDINVSYGSMKVGDVKGDTDLKLSFGSGSIGKIQDGDLTIKYSDFDIESAIQMELNQSFSDVEINEVDDLELDAKYGSVEIERANSIDSEVHYSDFEIGELTGKLEMECSYLGNFRIKKLAKSFTLVDIEGKFGSYDIALESGLNSNIEAEFSYADLKGTSEINATFHYRVKESNKSIYKGKIGKGDDSKFIRVDSSYGGLRLRTE